MILFIYIYKFIYVHEFHEDKLLKKKCVICTHDTQRAKYFNAFILSTWYFVNL